MPARQVSGLRQLGRAVGKSHVAVSKWLEHPRWQFGRGPWTRDQIRQIQSWAATTLAPNRAAGDGPGRGDGKLSQARLALTIEKAKAQRPPARGGRLPSWNPAEAAREILGQEPQKLDADQVVERVAARFLAVPLSAEGREKLKEFYLKKKGGRPEVHLAELVHLVLSSPEYQLN